MFFTAGTPQSIVDACHARLQDEFDLAMLVLGAAQDAIIAAANVHRTARAYGTRAEIFDGIGHDMMFEPGWERVADRIHAWVQ